LALHVQRQIFEKLIKRKDNLDIFEDEIKEDGSHYKMAWLFPHDHSGRNSNTQWHMITVIHHSRTIRTFESDSKELQPGCVQHDF